MKLMNYISESNDSNIKYTELKPIDRKLLQYILGKGINYIDDKLIYKDNYNRKEEEKEEKRGVGGRLHYYY